MLALVNALKAFPTTIKNCRTDVNVDSRVLIDAWEGQGSKGSPQLTKATKDLFFELSNAVRRWSGNNARSSNKYRKAKHRRRHCFTASKTRLRYTDKQYILRKAASALKDNPFLEANHYNSDDVSKKVRDNWKKLKERYINETHFREEVDFTLHPLEWTCANSLQSWRFGETKISLLARSMNMYVPFNIFIFILIFFLKLFPCYAVAYLVVY